ncbi:hypothetical protein BO83DRAFT_451584 [Aspergillus eucalypticola CBS 122712]|uniref:Uncharacterized protein n=1 Tax=Aspergillus eucalypticola (strain CBS 122712 / IBT 29274) TaxID=1448314 RepID=A0A317UZ06_ASPEC|nr:uncharacterized protein BO83DRAFT_451584 [Aspergillus eucalypticola CBS 122712]PWY67015.1 hypothetical protein BO83DRAFT_451584 [Aspergillus eucalypticola CBS 122712]
MPNNTNGRPVQGAHIDGNESSDTIETSSSVTVGLMEREIRDRIMALRENTTNEFEEQLYIEPYTAIESQEGEVGGETDSNTAPVDEVQRRHGSVIDLTSIPAPLEKALAKIRSTGMPEGKVLRWPVTLDQWRSDEFIADAVEDLQFFLDLFKMRLETLRNGAVEKDPKLRAALWRAEMNALDSPLLKRPRRE